MSFRRVSWVGALGTVLSLAIAPCAHAGEGTLLDSVRSLASRAGTGLIVAGPLEYTPPATLSPSEPETPLKGLAELLESQGMQLLAGPLDMRVGVRREHVPAWPTAFPESTWVRERCRNREPVSVNFGMVGAEARDLANDAEHLTGTEFADKQLIPASGTRLTILAERSYTLSEGCQVLEAALLLAGFEIEQRGGGFTIRRVR
jgi:hypothetical protein